jgi:uridine phosphorylase
MKREVTFNMGERSCHLEISYANPYVISGGSPGRVKRIAEYLDKVDEVIESDRGLATVHGSYKNIPITAFSTGMGSASVSITLPEIIEACDDPKMTILRIGTCGAFQNYMNIGDFIVTENVDIAEGTSAKIMGESYKASADIEVMGKILNAAAKYGANFQTVYVGTSRVTDDIYFDGAHSKYVLTGIPQKGVPLMSDSELQEIRLKYENVLGVSMEFSVYCALRDKYNTDFEKNIKVGNLLVVSDLVVEKEGTTGREYFEERKPLIEEAHIKTGLETLVGMYQDKFKDSGITSDIWLG